MCCCLYNPTGSQRCSKRKERKPESCFWQFRISIYPPLKKASKRGEKIKTNYVLKENCWRRMMNSILSATFKFFTQWTTIFASLFTHVHVWSPETLACILPFSARNIACTKLSKVLGLSTQKSSRSNQWQIPCHKHLLITISLPLSFKFSCSLGLGAMRAAL